MEQGGAERTAPTPDAEPAHTNNNRGISSLVINSASRRTSLFSRPRAKEDDARLTSSASARDSRTASPSNTRIPRPAQRRPFTLSDAYRMAEEEEAARGSPSPAPRSWRSRRASAESRKAETASAASADPQERGGIDGKSPRSGRGKAEDEAEQSDRSDSTFDEKLRQHALDQTGSEKLHHLRNGPVYGARYGTKTVGPEGGLSGRRPSRSGVDDVSSPRAANAAATNRSLLRRLTGRRRESDTSRQAVEPFDQAQKDSARAEPPHPGTTDAVPPAPWTPDRSFAWQADADFTAGDLQVSNSPPVAIRRSNTKIDEIRAREAEVNERFSGSPRLRSRDSRISNNSALESEALPREPRRPDELNEAPDLAKEDGEEGGDGVSRRRLASRPGAGVDEPGLRGIGGVEGVPRRALATARFEELPGTSIELPPSPSPGTARKSIRDQLRASPPLRDRLRRQASEGLTTKVPIQEAPGNQRMTEPGGGMLDQHPNRSLGANDTIEGGRRDQQALDQLAFGTVTGIGTMSESRTPADAKASDVFPPLQNQGAAESARQRLTGGIKSYARSVGFAGFQRTSSVESGLAKRTSFVHSDSDPTERIEGEMKLFAPMENQSEKGSMRAPSPELEEPLPEETPRPPKIDPVLQPTPKVTGAYVETPATIKVEDVGNHSAAASAGTEGVESTTSGPRGSRPPVLQSTKAGVAPGQLKRTQSTGGDRLARRSSSLSARRRARSLSRGRGPLINSARPPTVRDDLLEIQRANQLDDSTLDDIADLINHRDGSDAAPALPDWKPRNTDNERLDRKKELEAYDRMSRSLKTGLLGIRTAKQGIERLEDKVAHADIKDHSSHAPQGASAKEGSPPCPICHGSRLPAESTITYVHLPLPRLWHRRPKFKFTFLGLALFLLSLWYIAETGMCFRYCRPEYCYPGKPCDWSPDDPVWGYAIPVKLDQWVTGGRGRKLARRLQPDVADWLADVWDAATGVDITAVDTSRFSWEQNRQHRRRLAKRGLGPRFVERPEDEPLFSAWKSARLARERAQAAKEMGYEVDEDESIARDERI